MHHDVSLSASGNPDHDRARGLRPIRPNEVQILAVLVLHLAAQGAVCRAGEMGLCLIALGSRHRAGACWGEDAQSQAS